MQIGLELRLLETVQRAMREGTEKLTGPGLEGTVAKATLRAHRYMGRIVHVRTGRLKNSLMPSVHTRGNSALGTVGTGVEYAQKEHDRGGDHAFAQRTVDEEGGNIAAMFQRDVEAAV